MGEGARRDRGARDRAALLGARDPSALTRLRPLWRAYTAYFRPEVRSIERIPETGPVLLVGNHSGGPLMPDVAAVLLSWLDRFGPDRALYALGSDLLEVIPGARPLLRAMGVVPADPGTAAAALASGAAVLVYPGGDLDDCRAWSARHVIEFGHHVGFVRLALEQQVPVVPLVTHGSHESVIILTRGDRLARLLGLHRLRINVLPFVLGLPFGVAPIVVPYIPLPAKITIEVLEPIDFGLPAGAAADDVTVERCYQRVVDTMQAALERLAAVPALPILDAPVRAGTSA